jgi:hypothetical protein
MLWIRAKHGMLVANLGAYRGVVERTDNERTWAARVEARCIALSHRDSHGFSTSWLLARYLPVPVGVEASVGVVPVVHPVSTAP